MKTEQEMIDDIRKAVIMACHPECETYDDALEKELGFGCKVIYDIVRYEEHNLIYSATIIGKARPATRRQEIMFILLSDMNIKFEELFGKDEFEEIIGLPITLGRLMVALTKKHEITDIQITPSGNIVWFEQMASMPDNVRYDTSKRLAWVQKDFGRTNNFKWKFINEDGSDCTIEDQSQDTIRKLWEVLCG